MVALKRVRYAGHVFANENAPAHITPAINPGAKALTFITLYGVRTYVQIGHKTVLYKLIFL